MSTFAESLRFWTGWLLIAGTIVWLGWKQPLRYRFMSERDIASEEGRLQPTPTPSWVDTRYKGSRLDEPARAVRGIREGYYPTQRSPSRY